MKLIWTHEALDQLMAIEAYIAKNNPERAAGFVDELIGHAESLPGQPQSGRIVPEVASSGIRELIFKNYRIVYRLNEDCIEILTVFEGHRLLRMDEVEL
jgi:addiction module RelE/StbE family toxin